MSHDALDALNALDPGSMNREVWVRVAFAAKDAGITEDEFLEWSERGANFNRSDAISTYRNARPMAGGVTSATLFMMAHDAGFRKGKGNGGNGEARPAPAPRKETRAELPATDPRPVWNACRPVDVHGYLSRKQIKPHGTRASETGWLVVPYFNRERELQTLQSIAVDGTKRFLAGAKQRGSVALIGEPTEAKTLVVVEGFATGAAIHEASGYPVVIAGSRVTMVEAARIARSFAPQSRVVVAADRGDLSTPLAAARGVAGFLAVPGAEDAEEGFDFCDWKLSGASDDEIRARIDRAPAALGTDPEGPKAAKPTALARRAKAERTEGQAEPPPPVDPAEDHALDAYRLVKGVIVANLINLTAYLATGAAGELRYDTFTGLTTWRGMPVHDAEFLALTCEVQATIIERQRPFLRVSVPAVVDAAMNAAARHSFNSCVEYLESLAPWDGVERIERFLADIADIEPTDYSTGSSRYFWEALVSRMVKPGSQVDSALVLVGPQGIGKSSLARMIGGERYCDIGLHDIGSRDWCLQLRGKILVEISELAGQARAELESIKAVLTRTSDDYRAPYSRASASIPRGCVFVGTTNEPEFLIDSGGNRRWLPIECRAPFNLEALRTMREQYFAEAYARVMKGLPYTWHLVPHAHDVQARHVAPDPWADALADKLGGISGSGVTEIENALIYETLGIPVERRAGAMGRRIAAAMRILGYERSSWVRTSDNRKVRGFKLIQPPPL